MRLLSSAFIALGLFASAPAFAADDGPAFDKGPVWDYGQVKTIDGHFDDYMRWLAGPWKAQEEALKKAGYILDYKVLLVADPRSGEPDIILATKYANMAAFDHSTAEEYAFGEKVMGPLAKANKEQSDRGAIRTILGDMLVREAVLK